MPINAYWHPNLHLKVLTNPLTGVGARDVSASKNILTGNAIPVQQFIHCHGFNHWYNKAKGDNKETYIIIISKSIRQKGRIQQSKPLDHLWGKKGRTFLLVDGCAKMLSLRNAFVSKRCSDIKPLVWLTSHLNISLPALSLIAHIIGSKPVYTLYYSQQTEHRWFATGPL